MLLQGGSKIIQHVWIEGVVQNTAKNLQNCNIDSLVEKQFFKKIHSDRSFASSGQ